MSTPRAVLISLLIAWTLPVLAGCGEEEKDEGGGAGTPVASVTIRESEYRLDPASPTVERGGAIEFVVENVGGIEHALEVEGPSGEVETEEIPPRKSARITADLPSGRYTIYCPVGDHRQRGMQGAVIVGGRPGGAPENREEGSPAPDSGGGGY